MRRLLLGLICVLLVVGVANLGHASLFNFWSHGSRHSSSNGPQIGAVSQNTLPDHLYDPKLQPPVKDDNPFDGSNNDNGGKNLYADLGQHQWGTGPSQDGDGTSKAVPEPASLILLGAGLIALAGFGRKNFKQ